MKGNLPLEASQYVNKLGKFLYNHIDSAYKFKTSANTADTYITVYYQLPLQHQIPGKQKEGYNDMHEMNIDLNVTTYQNKLRVNIIDMSEYEYTIAHMVIKPEYLTDMNVALQMILEKVEWALIKEYQGYNFIF